MEEENNKLTEFLIDSVKRIEDKIDNIKQNMVTKEDCSKNQQLCNNKFKQKKIEVTPAKITAIGGILTILTGFIIALVKLFQ